MLLRDVLKLGVFENSMLVAGESRLDNSDVQPVAILEVTSDQLVTWIKGGELWISCLYSVADDVDQQIHILRLLRSRNASGLVICGIGYFFFQDLSPRLVAEAADFFHLSEPIKYHVEKGRIQKITGGWEAGALSDYFASLKDPNMYISAHVCYGCNPNARLEGVTAEDERVWGSAEWGFGHQGSNYTGGEPRTAKSHIDGISLNCSVYLDGAAILENGVYIEPTLKKPAENLGK
jgi:hypothetical protein